MDFEDGLVVMWCIVKGKTNTKDINLSYLGSEFKSKTRALIGLNAHTKAHNMDT